MISFLINSLIISLFFSYSIGYQRFMDVIKKKIWKLLNGNAKYTYYRLKPFDCELCLTFWSILIYGIIMGVGFFNLLLTSTFVSFLAPIFTNVFSKLEEIINKKLQ